MAVSNDSDVSGVGGGGGITVVQAIDSFGRSADGQPVTWVNPSDGHLVREGYTSIDNQTSYASVYWQAANSTATNDMKGINDSAVHSGINQRGHILTNTGVGYSTVRTFGTTTDGVTTRAGLVQEAYIRVHLKALSDASDEYIFRTGLTNNTVGVLGSRFIGFQYDRTTNTNWLCTTRDTSSTDTDSGIAVAADEWVELYWIIDGITDVKFYINGTLAATNTTNIPTNAVSVMHWCQEVNKSAHTTNTVSWMTGFQYAWYAG